MGAIAQRYGELGGEIVYDATVDEIEISETVARRVLRDGENVLFQSGWDESTIDPSVSMANLNLTSILCVPMRDSKRKILGVLQVLNKRDGPFTEADDQDGLAMVYAKMCSPSASWTRSERSITWRASESDWRNWWMPGPGYSGCATSGADMPVCPPGARGASGTSNRPTPAWCGFLPNGAM